VAYGTACLDGFEVMQDAVDACPSMTPRRLSITMITFVGTLSAPVTDLAAVVRAVADGRGGIFRMASNAPLVPGSMKSAMFRDTLSPCATTQLFASGKVQVAGCTSHIQFASLMDAVVEVLASVGAAAVGIADFDTHLVNINAGLGVNVRIGLLASGNRFVDLLNEALAPLEDRRRAEKRENFAPVTLVRPWGERGSVTCQLFASGSVQISGPSVPAVADAFAFLVRFLHAHAADVLVPMSAATATEDRAKTGRCWTELARVTAPALCHSHLPVRRLVRGCAYCALYGNAFV
jgi:hypothetical protein